MAKTTDGEHDGPTDPMIDRGFETHGPDRLWVGDIAVVAIAPRFVYVAIMLGAWPRRVVGHAVGRGVDARLAVAAFAQAIALRRPLPGCVMHTDRGSRFASRAHRGLVSGHGFAASMRRRGNPCDTPQAESFMTTLGVEAVHFDEDDTYDDVAADLPRVFDDVCNARRLHGSRGYLSPSRHEDRSARQQVPRAV